MEMDEEERREPNLQKRKRAIVRATASRVRADQPRGCDSGAPAFYPCLALIKHLP